jgi:hypothetical protein
MALPPERPRLVLRRPTGLASADCVVGSWRPIPRALHQPIERRHVGTLPALREEARGVHGCWFFGAGRIHTLVEADRVSLGAPSSLGLDRAREAQRMGVRIAHAFVLRSRVSGRMAAHLWHTKTNFLCQWPCSMSFSAQGRVSQRTSAPGKPSFFNGRAPVQNS